MNFIITLFFLGFAHADTPCTHTETSFSCVEYVKNYDGDTVQFNIPGVHKLLGNKVSVRINGIDTPEIKTKDSCEKSSSRIARNLVRGLLKNAQSIELRNVKRGKYFRILADIYADGKNIADLLIKNKLAVRYFGKTKIQVDWCHKRTPASLKGEKK